MFFLTYIYLIISFDAKLKGVTLALICDLVIRIFLGHVYSVEMLSR